MLWKIEIGDWKTGSGRVSKSVLEDLPGEKVFLLGEYASRKLYTNRN